MGLAHCPLCIGLAVLSAVRSGSLALLLWRLLRPRPDGGCYALTCRSAA